MRPWQFSKPKDPGFGISKQMYLSVLSSRPVLPAITEILAPKPGAGVVEGFGAPLSAQATKDSLNLPMERGAYALASKDRKTVMRMLVLSKEEAGFDPEAFVRSALAADYGPELISRIRGTWTLAQIVFESHDAMVYPALDFLQAIVMRMAFLTEGVVADPLAKRYRLPEEVAIFPRLDTRIDARDHVSIQSKTKPDGMHVFTLGLQKFSLPELEIVSVGASELEVASQFLIALAQTVLLGDLAKSGDRYGAPNALFEAREGGFDRALFEGIPVLELLPPTQLTASEALIEWRLAAQSSGS